MSYNASNVAISQPYLAYDLALKDVGRNKWATTTDSTGLICNAMESANIGFDYTSWKAINPQEKQMPITQIYQSKDKFEFKLDIESNCVVTQFFIGITYRNTSSDVTKNILHTTPMMNIDRIELYNSTQNICQIKPEEIWAHTCMRLSHGDKMFVSLIDNFGINSTYDIDASTNNLSAGTTSKEYLIPVTMFANKQIPWNVLTNNKSDWKLYVTVDMNKFILPTSPNQDYNTLQVSNLKLYAVQDFLTPAQYNSIISYPDPRIQYRIQNTQNSILQSVDTTTLLSTSGTQSVKISSRPGPCTMMLIGLRQKYTSGSTFTKFASFIPLNNIAVLRKNTTAIKNGSFPTDTLRNIQSYEGLNGDFFLTKNLVCYSFDRNVSRIALAGYHGAVEVLDDEFTIQFDLPTKDTDIIAGNSYELVVLMYQPAILTLKKDSQNLVITA